MLKMAGYVWQIVINALFIAVIVYVFAELGDRNLTIMTALLGLVYLTFRQVAIGQALLYFPMLASITRMLDELRTIEGRDPALLAEIYGQAENQFGVQRVKAYIDSAFLALVSLICIWSLLSVL